MKRYIHKTISEPITIIDSGIYKNHKAFDGLKFQYNNTDNIIKGINYFKGNYGDFIDDYNGHVTAVTSVISKFTDVILFFDVSYGKIRNLCRFDKNEIFQILETSYRIGSRIVV